MSTQKQNDMFKWAVKLLEERNDDLSKNFPLHCWTEINWQISYHITAMGRQNYYLSWCYNLVFKPNLQNLFTRKCLGKASTSKTIWVGICNPFEYDTSVTLNTAYCANQKVF